MNLDNIGSSGIGGLIGGVLALITDRLAVNRRLSKLEQKIESVVNHETCEIIRQGTQTHMAEMKNDMRYIRDKLDDVIALVNRHREDYKS